MIQHTRARLIPFCRRFSERVCKRGAPSPQNKRIFDHPLRFHSNSNGSAVNGSADGIIDSAAATAQWKRNQYQKLEDKFNNKPSSTDTQNLEPLNIDNYEDVQPMWKEMESRVTRRRSLTLEQLKQRGGVSGRQNIRKSEEDYWEKAGVYDKEEKKDDDNST
mmetsp:Transcript_21846/g.31276  ORF Transcript_21846/g.31276 Transcript_21846/m.31276 type:complete len:162 (+) Transcript_21846:101-586(+)|eukprot:CAMPEP_0201687994 /NCGR_PEP_ID=MMETSP0578-20130828/1797_1 /ASSEMBLY_ACC=CAM_ASM_000663 /TAXON_ID=267565 /ORGANISM="Skeletonema grethea, Strain CCMP 1804" /LENGTH=161 /DNA_ID=CAMNT_0048172183 /DNA_START=90 /DNA_END=575 /DNA_ORIENTATION=+